MIMIIIIIILLIIILMHPTTYPPTYLVGCRTCFPRPVRLGLG